MMQNSQNITLQITHYGREQQLAARGPKLARQQYFLARRNILEVLNAAQNSSTT